MPIINNLSWSNINSLRNYPLRDGVSRVDTLGIFTIPNDFIIDLSVAASSVVATKFFISQISNEINQFVIQISDNSLNVVGSFTVPVAGFSYNSDFYLQTTTGMYAYASGKITIGSLDNIVNQPVGVFNFTLATTEVEPRTVIVAISGINEIVFTDSNGTSQTLSGTVNIVARNNLRYSYDGSDNYLILDAGDGLGLNTSCTTPVCVQTINGVTPDSNGNISFIGLGCSTISADVQYTIALNDSCCTPCAGCDDLSTLTSRVNSLEMSYISLNNLYNYLNTQLTSFTNTVNFSCNCD